MNNIVAILRKSYKINSKYVSAMIKLRLAVRGLSPAGDIFEHHNVQAMLSSKYKFVQLNRNYLVAADNSG